MENNEKELIQAFQMMWGRYHEPVRLIDRKLRVLAGNEAYLKIGGQINVKCNASNPALHKGCKAMASLKEKETKIVEIDMDGIHWTSYWVPVDGYSDYFIHFTNGMNQFIEKQMSKSKVD